MGVSLRLFILKESTPYSFHGSFDFVKTNSLKKQRWFRQCLANFILFFINKAPI
jgi:hypothetical protein